MRKYSVVKQLVEDALDQYGKIPEQKKKADEAYKLGDIDKAILFENMIWQYMLRLQMLELEQETF